MSEEQQTVNQLSYSQLLADSGMETTEAGQGSAARRASLSGAQPIGSAQQKGQNTTSFVESHETGGQQYQKPGGETVARGDHGGHQFVQGQSESDAVMPGDGTMRSTGFGNDRPKHLGAVPENMPGPTDWNVTAEQTVAGQLEKNLSKDNPLFDTQRENVMRQYAQTGLRNSTMAMTQAEQQVINTAFQVSAQDAATFARSAEFNATMRNQFSAAEQAFMFQALLSDQNFNQARELQAQQIAGQIAAIGAQTRGQLSIDAARHEQQLQQMDANHQMNLQAMELGHQFNIDTMTAQTNLGMQAASHEADLQAFLMDRGVEHDMIRAHQQFNHNQQLQYQSMVSGIMGQTQQSLAIIGSGEGTAEQQRAGMEAILSFNNQALSFLGSLMNAGSGPFIQTGANPNRPPAADYGSYGQNRQPTNTPPPASGGVEQGGFV